MRNDNRQRIQFGNRKRGVYNPHRSSSPHINVNRIFLILMGIALASYAVCLFALFGKSQEGVNNIRQRNGHLNSGSSSTVDMTTIIHASKNIHNKIPLRQSGGGGGALRTTVLQDEQEKESMDDVDDKADEEEEEEDIEEAGDDQNEEEEEEEEETDGEEEVFEIAGDDENEESEEEEEEAGDDENEEAEEEVESEEEVFEIAGDDENGEIEEEEEEEGEESIGNDQVEEEEIEEEEIEEAGDDENEEEEVEEDDQEVVELEGDDEQEETTAGDDNEKEEEEKEVEESATDDENGGIEEVVEEEDEGEEGEMELEKGVVLMGEDESGAEDEEKDQEEEEEQLEFDLEEADDQKQDQFGKLEDEEKEETEEKTDEEEEEGEGEKVTAEQLAEMEEQFKKEQNEEKTDDENEEEEEEDDDDDEKEKVDVKDVDKGKDDDDDDENGEETADDDDEIEQKNGGRNEDISVGDVVDNEHELFGKTGEKEGDSKEQIVDNYDDQESVVEGNEQVNKKDVSDNVEEEKGDDEASEEGTDYKTDDDDDDDDEEEETDGKEQDKSDVDKTLVVAESNNSNQKGLAQFTKNLMSLKAEKQLPKPDIEKLLSKIDVEKLTKKAEEVGGQKSTQQVVQKLVKQAEQPILTKEASSKAEKQLPKLDIEKLTKEASSKAEELRGQELSQQNIQKQIKEAEQNIITPEILADTKIWLTRYLTQQNISLPLPIFNTMLPKAGTTSIANFFRCNKFYVSHLWCKAHPFVKKQGIRCGDRLRSNLRLDKPMFENMGFFSVFAQYEFVNRCFFPQITHLDRIHETYPNATFILNTRDVDEWIDSTLRWNKFGKENDLGTRIARCDFTHIGLPNVDIKNKTQVITKLRSLFHWQIDHMRRFVKEHPSHALVEVKIDDDDAGDVLGKAFFGTPDSENPKKKRCWKNHNQNQHNPNPDVEQVKKVTSSINKETNIKPKQHIPDPVSSSHVEGKKDLTSREQKLKEIWQKHKKTK